MTLDQSPTGRRASTDYRPADEKHEESRRPKKLIFAPGDIVATPDVKITATETSDPSSTASTSATAAETGTGTGMLEPHLHDPRSDTSTPTSAMESQMLSHPARAHQFVSNPPLTISQIHPSNPLHYFNTWFRDPRLPPSSAPETCTLATASLPSGRVSARIVYLKELDERGFVIYSNWGSKEGKGGQVFGACADGEEGSGAMPSPSPAGEDIQLAEEATGGNKWAALTFLWATVERQVRIEGLIEPLSREESEMYWNTRERGSQIGAWASWQSRVLWSSEQKPLVERRRMSQLGSQNASTVRTDCGDLPGDLDETDIDDGRAVLEQRVKDMQARFEGVEKIPLPPFWGGVRIVPESVEFWQGRRSRLHDRFRYVRVQQEEGVSWRIERLSP
ncbi:pyridoxamine phosphate oxidase [Aspergillus sclerotialis]|uniref:pyridoxal 5'-phosphate synthase n=1 Tax=Aspergillus sclerotialis TaxID=2070753 RepID=A0A3A2ZCH7_9EURO|nr:pyridoxamine phosphate oxidase [Aspergillus sclerotialis]